MFKDTSHPFSYYYKEKIMIKITFPDGAVREFESGVTTLKLPNLSAIPS